MHKNKENKSLYKIIYDDPNVLPDKSIGTSLMRKS